MALEVRKANDQFSVADSDLDKVDDGDPETVYTLRALTSAIVREIRKPYMKQVFNRRTHRLEDVPLTEVEEIAYGLDLLDYALVDWTGVVYQGQPIPCTREHKALLDPRRRSSLVGLAALNQATPKGEQAKADSFRESHVVLPVLG